MNSSPNPEASGDQPLQFEKAEYSENSHSSLSCCNCNNSIVETYFQVNEKSICPECRQKILDLALQGSAPGRFFKSLLFGLGAAALGSIVWLVVRQTTGYELGLLAVLVGWAVGAAVSRGSGAKGGWFYQSLAIVLTYLSIVSTYIPPIIQELREGASTNEIQTATAPGTEIAAGETSTATATNTAQLAVAGQKDLPPPDGDVPGIFSVLIAGIIFFAIILATPFLAGFQNILGLVIISFALYQAWKMNRKIRLDITGPFRVAPSFSPSHGNP